ncbi:MAG: GH1 family beta-glucosidase [Sedimentisphaeraceae bacterium JB056]
MNEYYKFPSDFIWGCSTSAYQIEGAYQTDGRGLTVWDNFCKQENKVHENHNGNIAADHYNRFPEDIELMEWLGIKNYRFSIAWSRIFPNGFGEPNKKGIDFYNKLIDRLLEKGIEPWITLFHWDLPQYLEDNYGGWLSRETSEHFADYCGLISKLFSDRVSHFMTINEFANFTDKAYGTGFLAPGKMLSGSQLYKIRHNALLAHGLGLRALRANKQQNIQVGIAEGVSGCVPAIENPEYIDAARKAFRHLNTPFLTTIMEGEYPEFYTDNDDAAGLDYSGDMEVIGADLDFVGVNVYAPVYIKPDGNTEGFSVVPITESHPKMQSPWAYVCPQIAYWVPRFLSELWNVDQIFITENGCAAKDKMECGLVLDTDRVTFIRNHLVSAHRAVTEGYPLKGYFAWSLLDNFEWIRGYSHRFGLFYVDFETQKRTPKLSAEFYSKTISNNAIC